MKMFLYGNHRYGFCFMNTRVLSEMIRSKHDPDSLCPTAAASDVLVHTVKNMQQKMNIKNQKRATYFTLKPALAGAIIKYIARADRQEHPSGHFDGAGRWYPSETCGPLCHGYRSPSRAYSYSALCHCRSAHHVAGLFSKKEGDVAAITKACRSRVVQQRDHEAIVNQFPPRRRPIACVSMLMALPQPATPNDVMKSPNLRLCELAMAKKPSKKARAMAQVWFLALAANLTHSRFPQTALVELARLHLDLEAFGSRIGIPYQCPNDLLASVL